MNKAVAPWLPPNTVLDFVDCLNNMTPEVAVIHGYQFAQMYEVAQNGRAIIGSL
jgi:hypothetical protein